MTAAKLIKYFPHLAPTEYKCILLSGFFLSLSNYVREYASGTAQKRPIHTLQKMYPFVGSTQRSKGKKQISLSLCYQILGRSVMKSL